MQVPKAVSWITTPGALICRVFPLLLFSLPFYFSPIPARAESAPDGGDSWYGWKRPAHTEAWGPRTVLAPLAAPDDSLGSKTLDPQGDVFLQHDVTKLSLSLDGEDLVVELRFAQEISPPDTDSLNGLVGVIELDLDQNPLTGTRQGALGSFCSASVSLGAEALVDLFGYDSLAGRVPLYAVDDDGTRSLIGTVVASFDQTRVSVRIPIESLGEIDGQVNAAAVVGTWLATSDCAPNSLVVQTGGEAEDPLGDTVPQHDIELLDLTVQPDDLLIRVEFSGGIAPPDIPGPTSIGGFIELDLDQDKGTGDREGPVRDFCPQDPNLGAEYVVNLFLYDSISGTAPLEPTNGGPAQEVGVSFESRAFTLTIPLAWLDGDDGTVAAAVVAGTSITGAPSDCAPDGTHASTGSRLYFSQFGNGDGFTSEIVLTNPFEAVTVQGSVDLLDDNGQPLSVGIVGQNEGQQQLQPAAVLLGGSSRLDFSIPPLGSVALATDGSGGVVVGSAVVSSDRVLEGVVRFTIPGIGIAGVGSSQRLDRLIAPARRKVGGISSGLALYNPQSTTLSLTLTLRKAGGVPFVGDPEAGEIVAAVELMLPGHGHLARFINELFPGVDTDDFEGTLVVEAASGRVVATVLQLGGAGEFLSLPVGPLR